MDEETIRRKVNRDMMFQHGERIQFSREELEARYRAPDYEETEQRLREEAQEDAAVWRPMMEEAKAKAKELGLVDWFPLFHAALERLEAGKK